MQPTKLILAWLVSCSLLSAAAPQWPQFRGGNSQGIAETDKPPIHFGAESNLLWKTALASGVSSPCIWNDRLFVTAVDDEKLVTICIDRGDGKILWRQGIAADKSRELHKLNNPAAATAATDGERLFVYFGTFGLVAYDFQGHELWRRPISGLLARNGSGTSPAVINGRLVLNCDVEEGKSFIAAFDPQTGKEQWRTPRPEFMSSYSTPVLWKHGNAEDIVVVGSLRVVGYRLNDGQERWTVRGTEAVSVCPTPVLGDGQLYVMSRSLGGVKLPPFALFALSVDKDADGKVSRAESPRQLIEQGAFPAVDRDQDGFITAAEWDESAAHFNKGEHGIFALKPPGEGDITDTHITWKHKKGVAPVSSPLFYRGRVYVIQDGGRLTCYNAKSGEKFMEQVRIGADGEYFASPIAADGRVYFASTRGLVTEVEAADTLNVVARNDVGEPIMATPAIADNTLYVRSEAYLWAFRAK